MAALFDLEARKQQEHRKEPRRLLKRLMEKEGKPEKRIEGKEADDKEGHLSKELEVVRSQRRKGVNILKELKS